MPLYIYGTVVTAIAASANNRADTVGNLATLQKLILNNSVYTSISAEAIRFALRYRFQLEGLKVNRSFDPAANKFSYVDEARHSWNTGVHFIDDDIMGFMDARAAQVEPPEALEHKRKTNPKVDAEANLRASIPKRQSPLAVGRAMSLRPYSGDTAFNSVGGEKSHSTLYRTEMHATEFQYTFALNTNDVADKPNILHLLDAIIDPPRVAGNSSHFYFDFSPASIILRLTMDHSARIQNCFDTKPQTTELCISKLMRKVRAGDVDARELSVGGEIAETSESKELQKLGANNQSGIKATMQNLKLKVASAYSIDIKS